jgi:hypothetical protein
MFLINLDLPKLSYKKIISKVQFLLGPATKLGIKIDSCLNPEARTNFGKQNGQVRVLA